MEKAKTTFCSPVIFGCINSAGVKEIWYEKSLVNFERSLELSLLEQGSWPAWKALQQSDIDITYV